MFQEKLVEMDKGIDVENHASFKIFPSRNRYEAYLCLDNEVESVAHGSLDLLASHLYGVKQLCFNESNDYFKLEIPMSVKGATWVTKNTFKRFLCFIDSKDLVAKAKVIEGEMLQLMEARNFHHSLYSQGGIQRSNGNIEGDGINSSDKSELSRPLLDASRNELLRAMDFRLNTLRGELEETLSQAVGATSSISELNYLEKFCEHLGAMDMRNSVRKFIEVIGRSQISVHAIENSAKCDQKSNGLSSVYNDTGSVDGNRGIPPETETIGDVQASSEGYTSSRNDTQKNRTVNLPKKITVGTNMRRSWPGRPATDNGIISNNNNNDSNTSFRVGENAFREKACSQIQANQERNERRMSVKDVISHFESKQKEQSSCVQRRKSSDFSTAVNNSVLRRWSLGTGEASVRHPHESDCDDCLTPNGSVIETSTGSMEVKPEADQSSSGHNPVQSTEQEVKPNDGGDTDMESHTADTHKEMCELPLISEDDNRPKETESKKTVADMGNPSDKQPYFDNRGRLYDYYQGKRDKRLRENATKYNEMEEQLRHLKLDLCSMEDETVSVNDSRRETKRNEADELFKSHNDASKLLCPKPDTLKKFPARTASLPSRRKSALSVPSPRPVSTKTSPEISTERPKVVHQRTPMPKPSPRPSTTHIEKATQMGIKAETTQNRQKNTKVLQAQAANTRSKFTADSQQKFTTSRKPVAKTKASTVQGESPDLVRSSSSSLSQKYSKKSSIVPLASKAAPRRRPETGSLDDPVKSEADVEAEAEASRPDEIRGESVTALGKKEADVDTDVGTDEEADRSDLNSENHGGRREEGHTEEGTTGRVSSVDDDGDVEMEEDMPAEVVVEECDGSGVEEAVVLNAESCGGVLASKSPDQGARAEPSSGRPATRQSLSQMLQEENSETENNEWVGGENASNAVYQKDAPRGLKRLLKFAQKSIGTANSTTTLSSPSLHSEGEEDAAEPKADAQKNSENTTSKWDAYTSSNKIRKAGMNGVDQFEPARLQEDGMFMSRTSSAKAKSFFSLSAFRTSKQGARRHN